MEYRVYSADDYVHFMSAIMKVARKFCLSATSTGVTPSYATKYAAEEADLIIVAYYEDIPLAFVLAKNERSSLHLGVICGKPGTGRGIMHKFLEIADSRRKNVSLYSLPSVLAYYTKPEFGFEFRKSCKEKALDASAINGKKPPANVEEFAIDPYFGPFLEELQLKGFNVAKTGECNKRHLSAEEIITNHCDGDGYIMFRCKKSPRKKRKEPKKSPRKQANKSPRKLPRKHQSSKSPRRKRDNGIDISNMSESKGVGKRTRRSPQRYK